MKALYPSSFHDLAAWASANHISATEARVRFVQYAVLHAIAGSQQLSALLVFKGGNALDFVWQPNRSTKDLDFSALPNLPIDGALLKKLLEASLSASGRLLGVTFRVHRVEQQPPGAKDFITYLCSIGYGLPDQRKLLDRMEKTGVSNQTVPVEISINEPICQVIEVDVQGAHTLKVSSLEDIVAEKLRALLQQPIRNRGRRQDLLDIACTLHGAATLDHAAVARFLLQKAAARSVPVSRAAFRNPEIERRTRQDYGALKSTTRTLFIPFDEAWASLLGFVDDLPGLS